MIEDKFRDSFLKENRFLRTESGLVGRVVETGKSYFYLQLPEDRKILCPKRAIAGEAKKEEKEKWYSEHMIYVVCEGDW